MKLKILDKEVVVRELTIGEIEKLKIERGIDLINFNKETADLDKLISIVDFILKTCEPSLKDVPTKNYIKLSQMLTIVQVALDAGGEANAPSPL